MLHNLKGARCTARHFSSQLFGFAVYHLKSQAELLLVASKGEEKRILLDVN